MTPIERSPERDAAIRALLPVAGAAGWTDAALAEAVYFTRDLVNEPANVLTTEDFAARLAAITPAGMPIRSAITSATRTLPAKATTGFQRMDRIAMECDTRLVIRPGFLKRAASR